MIVDPGGKVRRVIGGLSDLEGREQPIEFFGGRLAMQGHREALEVVHALPVPERGRRLIERTEAITCPKLLVVDPMTTFDLAVLVRPPRLDVPEFDASLLHGQREREGELGAVVALQAPDREGQRLTDRREEGQR